MIYITGVSQREDREGEEKRDGGRCNMESRHDRGDRYQRQFYRILNIFGFVWLSKLSSRDAHCNARSAHILESVLQ
jgi:hypothetical protein